MKKMLYIGHSFHLKTKSTRFLVDLFKTKYEVEEVGFDPYTETFDKFKELNGKKYDVVILFQIMPSINELKKYITYDYVSFFPMFDAISDIQHYIWSEYRDCNIINFSKTLHERCKKAGLSSYYIQYFPEPKEILNIGDANSIFFWQRRSVINTKLLEKLFDVDKINKLYWHNVPDPEQKITSPSSKWGNKVQVSTWFDTKDEANKYLQQASIYIAPRLTEGIGMSFLEAMAVGRCIIAPNYPTMNEYIQDGITGYLYNFKTPKKIKIKNIQTIQENTYKFIQEGYKSWKENKFKILEWIETDPVLNQDISLMDKKLFIDKPKKISLTLCKIKRTKKYNIFYILGFLPIKIKK